MRASVIPSGKAIDSGIPRWAKPRLVSADMLSFEYALKRSKAQMGIEITQLMILTRVGTGVMGNEEVVRRVSMVGWPEDAGEVRCACSERS